MHCYTTLPVLCFCFLPSFQYIIFVLSLFHLSLVQNVPELLFCLILLHQTPMAETMNSSAPTLFC